MDDGEHIILIVWGNRIHAQSPPRRMYPSIVHTTASHLSHAPTMFSSLYSRFVLIYALVPADRTSICIATRVDTNRIDGASEFMGPDAVVDFGEFQCSPEATMKLVLSCELLLL